MALFSLKFLLFLIALLVFYYLLPKKYQWIVLLFFSIAFYFICGSVKAGIFIVATVVSTFFGARKIDSLNQDYKTRIKDKEHPLSKDEKAALKTSSVKEKKKYLKYVLFLNFGILGVLKYGNFITGNINSIVRLFAGNDLIPQAKVLLPLGISFYTFQTMGYIIYVSRGKYAADTNIFKFALYTTYFPQIIQGPIGRYDQLAHQLYAEHDLNEEEFRKGGLRMLWGFFKKMIIAENLAFMVHDVLDNFGTGQFVGWSVFIGVLLYGIQMYNDFSGGIDIVLGVSEMLGIHMDENFRQPFMATSVAEFWRRWHMSLGNWMKDYVFYPIALSKPFARMKKSAKEKFGSYYGKVLPSFLASFITFWLVGIWHGASWRYVFYGTYQAILVSSNTLFEKHYKRFHEVTHISETNSFWKVFMMARTTCLITFGRYFDCAADTRTALRMFRSTFTVFNPKVLFNGMVFSLGDLGMQKILFVFAMICVGAAVDIANERGILVRDVISRQKTVVRWAFYYFAVLFLLIFAVYGPGYTVSDFMYQQF